LSQLVVFRFESTRRSQLSPEVAYNDILEPFQAHLEFDSSSVRSVESTAESWRY